MNSWGGAGSRAGGGSANRPAGRGGGDGGAHTDEAPFGPYGGTPRTLVSASHAPGASTENGNTLGTRPVVRQSKLYREKESGNAMKAAMGHDSLQWDTEALQGVFAGQGVYNAEEERIQLPSGGHRQPPLVATPHAAEGVEDETGGATPRGGGEGRGRPHTGAAAAARQAAASAAPRRRATPPRAPSRRADAAAQGVAPRPRARRRLPWRLRRLRLTSLMGRSRNARLRQTTRTSGRRCSACSRRRSSLRLAC